MTIDNHEWVSAIDRHPAMSAVDVLAGYHLIGAKTDIAPEDLDRSVFRLQLWNFLTVIDVDGDTYTYAPAVGHP